MQKIEYDREGKILTIRFRAGKSVDSEIKGNIVLDYDKKGHLIKIDVMDIDLEDFLKIDSRKNKKPIQKSLVSS